MELNLVEWNLNFGSDKQADVAPFVKEHLHQADILVFTETICERENTAFWNELEKQYELFVSENIANNSYGNKIVVAIKRDLQGLEIKQVYMSEEVKDLNGFPDIIHLTITYRNQKHHLLGVRIRIGGETADDDYKSRYNQFEKLVNHMASLENVILVGDFNNGMIKADSTISYEAAKKYYEYAYDNGKRIKNPLRFYNFHLMKEKLGEGYSFTETFGEESSWGLRLFNGILNFGQIKNDQIIAKNIHIKEKKYSWGFVRSNSCTYSDMLEKNAFKRGNKILHGYPDHAQLLATIEFKN